MLVKARPPLLNSIQALRAVAALLVVFFHATDGAFVIGAAGVDIFFVISGFIMGVVGSRETYRSFLWKRFLRIVPLYWAVTLAMCAASLAGVFARFAFTAETLSKSLLFIPYFDPNGQIWPLVVVGWTLNLEVFFYMIFAIGLAIAAPLRLSVVALCGLAVLGVLLHPSFAVAITWTSPLLLEFVAGLAISVSFQALGLRMSAIFAICGVIGLVLAFAFSWFDEHYRPLAWGIPAAMLVAGCVGIEHAGRWPAVKLRPIQKLGDASYSLYLTHGIIAAALHRAMGVNVLSFFIIVIVSIAIAFVSYFYFERPILQLGRSTGSASAKPKSSAH